MSSEEFRVSSFGFRVGRLGTRILQPETRNPRLETLAWCLLLAGGLAGCADRTGAAQSTRSDGRIRLSVMLIEARHEEGTGRIDPALLPVADALRAAFPKYRSFHLIAGATERVDVGQSVSVSDPARPACRSEAKYLRRDREENRSAQQLVILAQTWLPDRKVHQTTLHSGSGQVSFLNTPLASERGGLLITAVLPE